MNVDDLDVQLVARTPSEAQDLGLQLLRRHGLATIGAAAMVMAPIWGSLLVLGRGRFWITALAVWWFIPIISRVTLHVLSRAVFGSTPTILQTVGALPQIFDRSLISTLTWRRIQLRRALWMPTAALERLRGKDLRDRYRSIVWGGVGFEATVSTGIFFLMTAAMACATWSLALWFIPEGLMPDWTEVLATGVLGDGDGIGGYSWILIGSLLPAILIGDVAYSAAGFGMYLSRRTELEGWHIELAFRRMATRVEAIARRGIAILLPWVLAGAGLLGSAAAAQSEEAIELENVRQELQEAIDDLEGEVTGDVLDDDSNEIEDLPADHPRRIAEEVLATEEFDTTVERTFWAPTWEESKGSGPAMGGGIGPLLGGLLQGGFWILIVALVTWLVVVVARNVDLSRRTKAEARAPKPTEAFGLDLTRESLPGDIPGAARSLALAGDITGALSLLYRGALHHLVEQDELEIKPGDTEHDCMGRVRAAAAGTRQGTERASYFSSLTDRWLRAAWGAAPPAQGEAVELCDQWPAHFDVAAPGRAA